MALAEHLRTVFTPEDTRCASLNASTEDEPSSKNMSSPNTFNERVERTTNSPIHGEETTRKQCENQFTTVESATRGDGESSAEQSGGPASPTVVIPYDSRTGTWLCPFCDHKDREKCSLEIHIRLTHFHQNVADYFKSIVLQHSSDPHRSAPSSHTGTLNRASDGRLWKNRIRCPYCSKILSSRSAFEIHRRVQHGDKPYLRTQL